MKLPDGGLKTAYQATRIKPSRPERECPPLEVLLKAFTAEANEETKLKIADHVTGCQACQWKFEAVQKIFKGIKETSRKWEGISLSEEETCELKAKAKNIIHELGKRQAALRPILFRKVPIAAGLLIIVLAALFVFKYSYLFRKDITRGKEGQEVHLTAPSGEVESLPLLFKWQAYPQAEGYEIKLLDEELTDIWLSGKIKTPRAEFPENLFERLEKGKTYYWTVTAYLKTGKIIESNLQEFKVKKALNK